MHMASVNISLLFSTFVGLSAARARLCAWRHDWAFSSGVPIYRMWNRIVDATYEREEILLSVLGGHPSSALLELDVMGGNWPARWWQRPPRAVTRASHCGFSFSLQFKKWTSVASKYCAGTIKTPSIDEEWTSWVSTQRFSSGRQACMPPNFDFLKLLNTLRISALSPSYSLHPLPFPS
jgi:hypothetical protein